MRHKPPTIYNGKVGAKPRAPKGPMTSKRVSKYACYLTGGPMDGQTLYLESNSTLTFTLAGQTGRYIKGKWQCA